VLLSNLPALQVVVPLVSAPICLLLRRPGHAWACALVVSWTVLAMAVLLLRQVALEGTVSYPLGAWATPWGIEYRIDMLAALVILVIAIIGAVVMPYARRSVIKELDDEHIGAFYTCYLLCLTGLLGIVVTGDAFNLFVFLEISSLSSYVLISLGRDRRALTAAFQYLVMGTIGATFILIGVGLMYMMTGTLNMADLAQRLPAVNDTRTVRVAFAFVTVGVSIKLALFPLHIWLPNAYTYAPSVVSIFLAATATKVGVYVLLRLFFTVFGIQFSFDDMHVGDIVVWLAIAAVLTGSLVAIFQDNLKRMLAYSSVAQIGYIVLGIALATGAGVSAGIIYLFNHALIKGALFMALGGIMLRLGSVELRDLHGLLRQMPWTVAAIIAGGLSLIGVPLTAGFISKWYLVVAALEGSYWPLAFIVLASSLLTVIYVWRIVEATCFSAPGDERPGLREAPLSMLLPTWLLIALNLYIGVDAGVLTGLADTAAAALVEEALP
jgi:multicomponent Na+:H+ antiporter subunit D